MRRNLGNADRAVRVTVGVIMIVAGLFLSKTLVGIVTGLLGALLVLSGAVGFCHVYEVFHVSTSTKCPRDR